MERDPVELVIADFDISDTRDDIYFGVTVVISLLNDVEGVIGSESHSSKAEDRSRTSFFAEVLVHDDPDLLESDEDESFLVSVSIDGLDILLGHSLIVGLLREGVILLDDGVDVIFLVDVGYKLEGDSVSFFLGVSFFGHFLGTKILFGFMV